MQSMDESVQTLVNLGLSVLQAKVYIALAKSGTSTGRTTAQVAKVASQDVYRVLAELREKSLVEKRISRPNRYSAVPLKEGLHMLLKRRNEQTTELKKAVFDMSQSFQNVSMTGDKVEACDFILIPANEPIEKRFVGAWESVQTSLELMNDFQEGIAEHEMHFDLEIKALNNGVKIRNILSKTQKKYKKSKLFSALLEREPGFQVKYTNFPLPAKILIKDNKEVFISTENKPDSYSQPYLWSNNLILVRVIQQWYDIMWEKCVET
jgi:sugar-specific transcriptional regulator TrmB